MRCQVSSGNSVWSTVRRGMRTQSWDGHQALIAANRVQLIYLNAPLSAGFRQREPEAVAMRPRHCGVPCPTRQNGPPHVDSRTVPRQDRDRGIASRTREVEGTSRSRLSSARPLALDQLIRRRRSAVQPPVPRCLLRRTRPWQRANPATSGRRTP
jgi:hypothetical protein